MNEDISVKEKLLEVGRKEFLLNGYEKASLRKISKTANVTTGAIYFFFKNKEEFLKGVVDETATEIKSLISKFTDSEIKGQKTSGENDREFVEFLYKNKETAMILLEKAEGTPYEGFKNEICELLEKAFMLFYEKYGGEEADGDIVKLIVKMRIQGIVELIKGGYDLDMIIKYSQLMAVYGDSGFDGMMKQYKSIIKGSVE